MKTSRTHLIRSVLRNTNTLTVALAAAVLAAPAAWAASNALVNPGWEAGSLSSWQDSYTSHSVDSTNALVYGSTTKKVVSHSGAYVYKTWGTYWGSGFVQTHTTSQFVPAAAATKWSADVWVSTATPDNLAGQNVVRLQVTFCDVTSNAVSEVYYSPDFTASSPLDTWVHLVVTNTADGSTNLTAPDGTAFVRFALVHTQDATQAGGSVYWDDANLIKTSGFDPEISQSPRDTSVIYGQAATFNVIATGATALSYKWHKDGLDLSNGGHISGATTDTLTISNAAYADQGFYTVTVTDQAGSVDSPNSGYLTVIDPGILTNPVSLVKIEGQTATFTVVAAGSGTLAYSWYRASDGLQVENGGRISGATTPTLTIANVTMADTDGYFAIVQGAGQVNSTTNTLSVKTLAESSNLMLNGGMETGSFSGWPNKWNGQGVVAAPAGGETNYNGAFIGQLWSTGVGTWNGVNQSFSTKPGYAYIADGWFLQSAGAKITGASEGWLEINFYQAANLLTSIQSARITSNSVVGTWIHLTAGNKYAVAPAGADEVRCQINYHAQDGEGALYFDNLSLWLKIPVTVVPAKGSGGFTLSFPAQAGVNYEILYSSDLNTWQLLQTATGGLSGQISVTDTAGAAQRFYRVNTL